MLPDMETFANPTYNHCLLCNIEIFKACSYAPFFVARRGRFSGLLVSVGRDCRAIPEARAAAVRLQHALTPCIGMSYLAMENDMRVSIEGGLSCGNTPAEGWRAHTKQIRNVHDSWTGHRAAVQMMRSVAMISTDTMNW